MKISLLITLFFIFSLSAKDSAQLTKDLLDFNTKKPNWDMLENLPEKRKLALIEKLMTDKNGQIQYIACSFLIRQGKEDQTIETLAKLITSGKSETDLKGRMGYDWAHSDDDKLAGRMMLKIVTYLNENFKAFPKKEQARALNFFKKLGLTGSYTKDKVNKLILQFQQTMEN